MIKFLYIKALASTVMMATPNLMVFVSFMLLAYSNTVSFNAQTVFVSLVYFNMLRLPLMMLPQAFASVAEAKVSADRMAAFFIAPELTDQPERVEQADNAVEVIDASYLIHSQFSQHILCLSTLSSLVSCQI